MLINELNLLWCNLHGNLKIKNKQITVAMVTSIYSCNSTHLSF